MSYVITGKNAIRKTNLSLRHQQRALRDQRFCGLLCVHITQPPEAYTITFTTSPHYKQSHLAAGGIYKNDFVLLRALRVSVLKPRLRELSVFKNYELSTISGFDHPYFPMNLLHSLLNV